MLNHSLVPVGSTGYDIPYSARFNDDDSAYLSRTPSTAGNRKTWTWSGWVKRGNLGTTQFLFGGGSATRTDIYFDDDDNFNIAQYGGMQLEPNQVFRDPSAWYHIVIVMDTTQATAANRTNMYINGVEMSSFKNETYPSQNADLGINDATLHRLGARAYNTSNTLDSYLAEVNFVDGQALTPSDFGEIDEDYGHWKPKKYTGTYGTNGFYLDFKNSGSLGNDVSGAGNNWTPNNLAATDQMLDSPTNNFATYNPLNQSTGVALREGNTNMYLSSNDQASTGTFGIDSGKWYVEVYYPSGDNPEIGLIPSNQYLSNRSTVGANSYEQTAFITNGGAMRTGSWATTNTTGLSSQTGGGVIGIAIDADADKMWFTNTSGTYFNSGNPATGSNPQATFDSDWVTQTGGVFFYSLIATGSGNFIISNFGQDSSFAGNKTAQGNSDGNGIGDFYYTPPTGFLALCTQNLPEPTVVPSEHFNTVTYTGDGTTSNAITGVGFQPDFVWAKSRSAAQNNGLVDVIRGGTNRLISNSTAAESTILGISFGADGFTSLGSFNTSATTYVAWNWKANGAGVSNTDGSITSTVSANVDAGFSIVSYIGDNTDGATIGHGLSIAPDMVIWKNRSTTDNWVVWHTGHPYVGYLENTASFDNLAAYTNLLEGTDPSSTLLTVGANGGTNSHTNGSGNSIIAYAFHSVEGYSKVGSYTGNGSTDGTFVYTGFRPAYVMVKRTSDVANWVVVDNDRSAYNVANAQLAPDSSAAETTNANLQLDFTSNGFKLRGAGGGTNISGDNYIFMAFAEMPFKHSTGR